MTISQIKKRLQHGQIKTISEKKNIPVWRSRNVLSGKIKDKVLIKKVIAAFSKELSKTK